MTYFFLKTHHAVTEVVLYVTHFMTAAQYWWHSPATNQGTLKSQTRISEF